MRDSQIIELLNREVRPTQMMSLNILVTLRVEFEKRSVTTQTLNSNSLADFFGWLDNLLNPQEEE